jgi:hypothetical protein
MILNLPGYRVIDAVEVPGEQRRVIVDLGGIVTPRQQHRAPTAADLPEPASQPPP